MYKVDNGIVFKYIDEVKNNFKDKINYPLNMMNLLANSDFISIHQDDSISQESMIIKKATPEKTIILIKSSLLGSLACSLIYVKKY
jgi:hypothetical protein